MFEWVQGIIERGGYLGLLFLMFIENVFPPIPSELILPMGGYLAKTGEMSFPLVILMGGLGATLGSLPLYYIGYAFGEKRVRNFCKNHGFWLGVDEHDFDKAKQWFSRHQGKSIFLCRMVPGVRSLIAVPAGVNRMELPKYLLYTFLGSSLWSLFLVTAGYFLGASFKRVDEFLGPFSKIIVGAIVLYFVYRAFSKWRAKRKKS